MSTLAKIVFASALLVACTPEQKDATSEQAFSASLTTPTEACYLQVTTSADGALTDSLYVRLVTDGREVSGVMNWVPAEKDRMRGKLSGQMTDSVITALYIYESEGVIAQEEKIFKLERDRLRMRTGELVNDQGTWVLKDTAAAPFAVSLPGVPCTSAGAVR